VSTAIWSTGTRIRRRWSSSGGLARYHADIEAVYTDGGTDGIQSLIVGRAITGLGAFT